MEGDRNRTDGELLAAFADRGDQSAFGELAHRHGAMVYGVCLRVVRDHHEAEDIAQAVFLTLARKAGSLRRDPSVGGWLHTVARRLAKDVRNARFRRQAREDQAMRDQTMHNESGTDSDSFREQIDDAIGVLPERYRLPLVLFHLRGCSLEQIASQLCLNSNTVSTRLARAREMLRKKLVRRGVTVGSVGALTTLLSAEAGAAVLPASFVSATTQAASLAAAGKLAAGVGTGVVSAKVAALTKGACNMLFWSSVKTAAVATAAAVVVAGSGAIVAQEVAAQRKAAEPPAATAGTNPATASTATNAGGFAQAQLPPGTIVPRGASAQDAFEELSRRGGPRVEVLGRMVRIQNLLVPVERRFRAVAGRDLIAGVAALHGLNVQWVRDDKVAVLYSGATDTEIESVGRDLAAADPAIRRAAAWRAGWLEDPRIVPLLSASCRSDDPDLARQAQLSLGRLNWSAVVALGFDDVDILAKALADQDWNVRRSAAAALGQIGGEKALALLEKVLGDQDQMVRRSAAEALGRIGGEKVLVVLEKALADQDLKVRDSAARGLGQIGREKAVALLEKHLADQNADVRGSAISALGQIGGEKAVVLLEKALAHQYWDVRISAAGALVEAVGQIGEEKALALLEKHLADRKWIVRSSAAGALGQIGGEKALALLEKAFADQDPPVRCSAARTLGQIGGEKALALLEKALADQVWEVRLSAIYALGQIGGEKALALLEKALAGQNSIARSVAVQALGQIGGEKALALLEKALADQEPIVRAHVAGALSQNGGEKVLALCERAFADKDWTVRNAAVIVLGQIGGEKAVTLLEKALADQDPKVRLSAVNALGGKRWDDRTRDLFLARLAQEQDREVLRALISALQSNFPDAPAVKKALADPALQARLQEPKKPTSPEKDAAKSATAP